jgi:peptidoglycan/LPS O-acetylase OafA/YrhL
MPAAALNPPKAGHFVALDAVRGLAALVIVIYHLLELFGIHTVFTGSYLAVDLFFLMSGFVIAFSYDARILDRSMSFWRFVQVRAIRLYPLYLVACMLGATYYASKIVLATADAPTLSQLALSTPATALILPVWGGQKWGLGNYPYAPAAWSLSLEFWFNLLYALVVIRWRTPVLAILAGASFLVLCLEAFSAGSVDLGWSIATLLGGSARFWFSFTAGVILFRITRAERPALSGWWMWLAVPVFLFVAIPVSAVAIQLVWVGLIFPGFVYIATRINLSGNAAWLADHLGRQSYGIYILHGPVMMLMMGALTTLMRKAWLGWPMTVGTAMAVAVFVSSALLTYLIDEPVRRWLRFRSRLQRAQAEAGEIKAIN